MAGDLVHMTVDGAQVQIGPGATLLDACAEAGVYVPRLCAYPGLEPTRDCGVCYVLVTGAEGAVLERACAAGVADGLAVDTDSPEVRARRAESMRALLARHPHACLVCPDRDGCARDSCTYGIPPEARCCDELGRCEFGEVAGFVGEVEAAPEYRHRFLGVTVDHNVRMDHDQCIGCARCVAACAALPEAGSALRLADARELGARTGPDDRIAVPKGDDLRSSGCTFCAACIVVCPTGALSAEGPQGARWLAERRERTSLPDAVLPPAERVSFDPQEIAKVPETSGVFCLYDGGGTVLQITGVMNLRAGLRAALDEPTAREVRAFTFEEEQMYTQRESELLAAHLREHGSLPPGSGIEDDLFDDGLCS